MKTIKNYRLLMGAFLAIFTVAIGLAVAWSSLVNNAFANDGENTTGKVEEATANEENASAKFSFSFSGLEPGVVPEIEAKDASGTIEYTPGTYLEIDDNSTPVWNYKNGTLQFLVSSFSGYTYTFKFYDPFGYECISFPEDVKITGTTDFVIGYKGYEGTYSIKATVKEYGTGAIVPNCELTYSDKDYNIIAIASTGADGICTFEGIKREQTEGFVAISQDGYVSDTDNIDRSDFDKTTHTATADLTARSDAESKLKLRSSDEHHQAYELSLEVRFAADPSVIIQSWYNKAYKISTNLDGYEGDWTLSSDGVFLSEIPQGEVVLYWSIKPIGADGYKLDYCTIDRGDGNKFNVSPNDTFKLNVGDKIWMESFYTDAPQPQPEPTPDPTPGEDVNAVAQTGDNSPLVPFLMLVVLAGGVLLYTRKLAKN